MFDSMSDRYERLRRTAETFVICQFSEYIIINLIHIHLCKSRVLNGICKIIANLDFIVLTLSYFIPP